MFNKNFLPRVLSVAFHPIFLPLFILAILYFSHFYRFSTFDPRQLNLSFMLIIWMTIAIPGILMLILKKLKMVDTLEIRNKKQRIVPLLVIGFCYLLTYLTFEPGNSMFVTDTLVSTCLLGAMVGLVTAFFINLVYFKVSFHAIGMASLVGIILLVAPTADFSLKPLLLITCITMGAVGSARMRLNVHTLKEVFVGYFIGFVSQFFSFLYLAPLLGL